MSQGDGFGHERGFQGETDDWITPQWILDAFGPGYFDLDPCASVTQPWPTARRMYTVDDDGLSKPWLGNVWLNPPYGPHTAAWVRRLADHGTGIALIFARTETRLWQDDIFPTASGYLFLAGRVRFYRPDGSASKGSGGAPSALIAWGDDNRARLIDLCDQGLLPGAFVDMAFYTGSSRGYQQLQVV